MAFRLTRTARLTELLGFSLLTIGLLLWDWLLALLGALLLIFLMLQATSFQRAVNIAKRSVSLEVDPKRVDLTVGTSTKLRIRIRNESNETFRVVDVSLMLPLGVDVRTRNSVITLSGQKERAMETVINPAFPGRFKIPGSTLTLQDAGGMFRQSIHFRDRIVVTSFPISQGSTTLTNLDALFDLAADPIRRGIGTDLAGLRPFRFLDDYHRIDWKATARTGSVMSRDYHAEKEPAIILLVDILTLAKTHSTTRATTVLSQLANLLGDPILMTSAMGLALFDEHRIIATFDPEQGSAVRRKILQTLVETSRQRKSVHDFMEGPSRPYSELMTETRSFGVKLDQTDRRSPLTQVFASFAGKVMPYYTRALSTHFSRLRNQGVFRAFQYVSTLRYPALIVLISDARSGMIGLIEGAGLCAAMTHRLVVAIIRNANSMDFPDSVGGLVNLGANVVATTPAELWTTINKELLAPKGRRALGRVTRP